MFDSLDLQRFHTGRTMVQPVAHQLQRDALPMRALLALTMFTACSTASSVSEPSYDSVRDRLSDRPERLFVGSEGSTGTVTARRWTNETWVEGVWQLVITTGEMVAKVDSRGKLTASKMEVGVGP